MIGRLTGKLAEKRAPEVLLDVHGVGYECFVPMSTYYSLPELDHAVSLLTHLVVREDSQTLYGFATHDERLLFRSLLKVNGVGAKLALAILSGVSTADFVQCIEHEDTAMLVRLPGVGKKTAERLIIEMKDRIKDLGESTSHTPMSAEQQSPALQSSDSVSDAVSALIALGYKAPEASRMVRQVDNMSSHSSEELIRQALQSAVQ